MSFNIKKGEISESDIYQIHLLDCLFYADEYLLTIEELKERLSTNPNIIYTIRDKSNIIAGYYTIIPVTYDAYMKIKNGELDKEVITKENILTETENINYMYFDSVVLHPKYRGQGLSKRLRNYVLQDVLSSYPNLKRIVGRTITPGGYHVALKQGLVPKAQIDSHTVVMERVMNQKPNRRKKLFPDRNKRAKELKSSRAKVNITF